MNKEMIKDLPRRFKVLFQLFLRDALIFLLFWGVYTGVKAGFQGTTKIKTVIQELWNKKDKVPAQQERRTRPRTRKEISQTV